MRVSQVIWDLKSVRVSESKKFPEIKVPLSLLPGIEQVTRTTFTT